MKSPFLIALSLGAASLLVAAVPVVWRMLDPPPAAPVADHGAPWQVQTTAAGASRVFDLALPGSTVAQARQRWGENLRLAVMADADRRLALEAYVERFSAGGLAGRLVLAFDADAGDLARWRDDAPREPTGNGGWRHPLKGTLADAANASPLVGVTLLPAARLDAQTLNARFGAPAEQLVDVAGQGERLQHWLYPAIGLAVALDAEGKDVLQYVAPADFEARLAAPLRAR
jgi:hypothetical protein